MISLKTPTAIIRLFLPAWLLVIVFINFSYAATDCDQAAALFSRARWQFSGAKSIAYYRQAIRLCPGYIRPYELIGNWFRKNGQPDKAVEYFSQAAELGSTNYKLYYLLAALLYQQGGPDEASRYLNKSLGIRKDYAPALALKAKIDKALDKQGPKIMLFEPPVPRGMNIVYKSKTLTVRGMAVDKSGLAWVQVNGLKAAVDKGGNFFRDISLRPGANPIRVTAADSLGNQASLVVTVEGPAPSPAGTAGETLYEKSFAVVIGINNYEKWPPLEFAVNDATAVARELRKRGFKNITTILDRQASQRRILTELFHALPRKVSRNDRVLFYFAGHGQTEDLPTGGKKGYIIPADATTAGYSATAISMEQIRSLSSRIAARHILYVMDSCYSGLGLNRSYGMAPGARDYLVKVASKRSVQIITAGGKGEQVQEKKGHGLFTTYFLQGLAGAADLNADGVVTGTELGTYLRPRVSIASHNAQTPLFGRLEGEGEFLFFTGNR